MSLRYSIIFIMLAVPIIGISQQSIKGNVTSNEDGPLIGATVRVLNTSAGTVTDLEGNFELSNVSQNSKIVASFVGYVSDTLSVRFGTSMNIVLKEDSENLDEVLIQGKSSSIDELKPILNELISEKERPA